MKVILVNPQSKRLKNNGAIGRIITERYGQEAHIICHDGISDTGQELRRVAAAYNIREIFVVGGDGTFNKVLNWALEQTEDRRPVIMSVGGGEMCYFARAQGLKSSNPLKNLEGIFSGKIKLQKTLWRPLKLFNVETKKVRYAGVIANGAVCDFVDWYEDLGKGSALKVVFMILVAVFSILSDSIRKRIGRLNYANGSLVFEATPFHSKHIAFVSSVIHEILPTCKPFRGNAFDDFFYTIAYSLSFRRLAVVLPLVWFGKSPRTGFHNEPIARVRFTTDCARFVIDGDSVNLSNETNCSQSSFLILKGGEALINTVCP